MTDELSTAVKPSPNRQRRSLVTQSKLMEAAALAFAEHGFRGTSTRDIAERAQVNHPLITYHFKNKDELWRHATNRLFHELRDALADAVAGLPASSVAERAEALIRAYIDYTYRRPELHKIILHESAMPSARLQWMLDLHLVPLYEKNIDVLSELQDQGIVPQGDPTLLFHMIRVAGACGVTSAVPDADSPEFADRLADLIVRIFLPGLAGNTDARG